MAQLIDGKIVLSEEEKKQIKGKDFHLIPNSEGVFLLIDVNAEKVMQNQQVCFNVPEQDALGEEKQQIIEMIKKKKLSELVEGKLEEQLNKEQKEALKQLLEQKVVYIFKLNDSYKKGVFKLKREEERKKVESENAKAGKKLPVEYDLKRDGFLAITNQERAKMISQQFKEEIEKGEVKGIKSFEGVYYLINSELLEDYQKKAILLFEKEGMICIDELAEKLEASKELVKIVCEFLKEDGEVFEKKKNHLCYIG